MEEDIQKQILDELRKQTAMFKKINIASVAFMVFVAVCIAMTPFLYRILDSRNVASQPSDSWKEAYKLQDRGEYQKAQEMLQKLINKHPDFYYGYSLLGFLHQELGNVKEAEANYAKAYDLFPTEENKKSLAAIRIVLDKKNTANK